MEKISIEKAITAVQDAPGSMYTREDVISLLKRLEVPSGGKLSERQIKDLVDQIVEEVESNADNLSSDDLCDLSSAEFELNGNEISLLSVDINTGDIGSEVTSGIADVVESFFENLEEN